MDKSKHNKRGMTGRKTVAIFLLLGICIPLVLGALGDLEPEGSLLLHDGKYAGLENGGRIIFNDDSLDNLQIMNAALGIGIEPFSNIVLEKTGNENIALLQGGWEASLVGHWKMNDNAATTVVEDSSSNENDGESQQNTEDVTTTGLYDNGFKAFSFNGTSDYIDIPYHADYEFTAAFSISVWVKTNKLTANQYVYFKDWGAAAEDTYYLIFNNSDDLWYFGVMVDTSLAFIKSDSAAVTEWTHIVCTRSTAGAMKMYVNAVEQTQTATKAGAITNDEFDEGIYVGRYWGGNYFSGSMDNLIMFNDVLNQTNVNILYDNSYYPSHAAHFYYENAEADSVKEMVRFERAAEEGSGENGIGLSLDMYLENEDGNPAHIGSLQWSFPSGAGEGSEGLFEIHNKVQSYGLMPILKIYNNRVGFLTNNFGNTVYFNMQDSGGDGLSDKWLTIDMGGQNRTIDFSLAEEGDNLGVEADSAVDQDLTTDASGVTFGSITLTGTGAPVSPTATGTEGQIAFDSKYIYRCVATNTWKRTEITTWTDSYLLMETGDKILTEDGDFIILE
jgi:hypothetical protein